MSYTVTYTVADAFTTSEGVVALNALENEIELNGIITTMLDKAEGLSLGYEGEVQKCYIPFKIQPTQAELDALLVACNNHTGTEVHDPITTNGKPIVALDAEQDDHAIRVANVGVVGADLDMFSHDFCDKTTWWSRAIKVTEEVLTTSDNLTYETVNTNIVNLYSGKITDEKNLWPEYLPVVTVDDVVQPRHDPFTGTGGNHYIDHANGNVVFDGVQSGTIKLTYYHVDDSDPLCSAWVLEVPAGKIYDVHMGVISLSLDDWDINSATLYEIYVGDYTDINNRVGYSRYDTIEQLIDESGDCIAEISANVGGATRGITSKRYKFKLEYMSARVIQGISDTMPVPMTLCVRLDSIQPHGGSRFVINLRGYIRDA